MRGRAGRYTFLMHRDLITKIIATVVVFVVASFLASNVHVLFALIALLALVIWL